MNKTRFTGAAIASAMTLAGLVLVTSPAVAAEPTGGCWVYYVSSGAPIETTTTAGEPSSSLASWADPDADPAGPADYVLTTSGSSAVGGQRNLSLTFNKGPKNGGPQASGTAHFFFSVNGKNLPAVSKPFGPVANMGTIPGDTVTASFPITSTGPNTVVFRKVIYDVPTFTARIQCNGQTSGTPGAAGPNPATNPVNTNIVSEAFNATPGTLKVTKAGQVAGQMLVGKTLKAKAPTTAPSAANISYQWLRNGKKIKKANSKKYKLVKKDEGKKMQVEVTLKRTGYKTLLVKIKAPGKVSAN